MPTTAKTVAHLLGLLRSATHSRRQLLIENTALRQQLAVLRRSVKRPQLDDADRLFWILLRRHFAEWRECLHVVKPSTVIGWHRRGYRYYWARKSKPRKIGRPSIPWKLVHLIRRMAIENVGWGAPRIHDELALLGHSVAESTVSKYMPKGRHPGNGEQKWRTFLANHLSVTAACDFFVVPSLTFKSLCVFVVLSLDRRRIQHVGVTHHPTAEWTAQQINEAFPDQTPRFLLHDRDAIYGHAFRDRMKALEIAELRTPIQCPWRNGHCERVIGSIRRECTDHVIPLGERHLAHVLREYVAYYNAARTHQALAGNSPEPRWVDEGDGEIVGVPVLNGLHHRYERAA